MHLPPIMSVVLGAVAILSVSVASAAFIETSAGCGSVGSSTACDGSGDDYGYIFRITDSAAEADAILGTEATVSHGTYATSPLRYHATLTNTSPLTSDGNLDVLYFNMTDGVLGTDFNIDNIAPNWTFASAGGGIQFDYVGYADNAPQQPNRVGPQESLVFDFVFTDAFLARVSDPFTLWTGSDESMGQGAGGGEDSGQVAVHIQSLETSEGSDLLASNWDSNGGGGGPPQELPEPGTLLLLGAALLGLGMVSIHRRKKYQG